MKARKISATLQKFIDRVTELVHADMDEKLLHPEVATAMKQLVAKDDWLDEIYTRPHADYYQQYLLYADPDDRFSVVSFVWGPGQHTPIHDHTVWGVVGMLRGEETNQNYEISDDGTPIPLGEVSSLLPGDIALVSPAIGDIHRVSNALSDQVSISIHAYGGNIGRIKRHVFPDAGGEPKNFISGYANGIH